MNQTEKAKCQEISKELDKAIETLESELLHQEHFKDSLQQDLNQINQNLGTKQQVINRLAKRKDEVANECERLASTKKTLEEKLRHSINQTEFVEREIFAIERKKNQIELQIGLDRQEIEQKKIDLARLQRDRATLEDSIVSVEGRERIVSGQVEGIDREILNEKEVLDALKTQQNSVQEKLAGSQGQFELVRQQKMALIAECEEKRSALSELSDRSVEIKRAIEKQSQENQSIDKKALELSAQVDELKIHYVVSQREYLQLDEEKTKASARKCANELSLAKLNKQLANLQKSVEVCGEEYLALSEEVVFTEKKKTQFFAREIELKNQLAETQKNREETRIRLQQLKKESAVINDELRGLHHQIEHLSKENQFLENAEKEENLITSDLNRLYENRKSQYETLCSKRDALTQTLEGLNEQKSIYLSRNNRLELEVISVQERIETLATQKFHLSNSLEKLAQDFSYKEDLKKSLMQELVHLKDETRLLSSTVSENQSVLDNLDTRIAALREKIAFEEYELSAIKKNDDEALLKLAILNDLVMKLEKKAFDLQTTKEHLEKNVLVKIQNVKTNSHRIHLLQETIEKRKASLSLLKIENDKVTIEAEKLAQMNLGLETDLQALEKIENELRDRQDLIQVEINAAKIKVKEKEQIKDSKQKALAKLREDTLSFAKDQADLERAHINAVSSLKGLEEEVKAQRKANLELISENELRNHELLNVTGEVIALTKELEVESNSHLPPVPEVEGGMLEELAYDFQTMIAKGTLTIDDSANWDLYFQQRDYLKEIDLLKMALKEYRGDKVCLTLDRGRLTFRPIGKKNIERPFTIFL